ncbi:hypothetical protein HMPREF3191_01121 [Veillonellaceae bacterium DNF00626]|nr:hypothetical protein HMPREF3191_01121 [Veillonellaceae bacterium DNF00626]
MRKSSLYARLTSTVNSFGIATFSVRGEGLRFFDFLKCMNTIFPGFQMTATVLQHLRLHKWFTFSATGISVAQPVMVIMMFRNFR